MTPTQTRLRLGQAPGIPLAQRRLKPVKLWAGIGVMFVAIPLLAVGGWLTSADFERTPKGPTPVPGWMEFGTSAFIVVTFALYAALVWVCLIRPWRRSRRITIDGLLLIACQLLFWQDPLGNYFQTWFSYNSALLNRGSWASHIPGWMSPNGHQLAEPLLWVGPIFVAGVFGPIVFGNWMMGRLRARYPQLGNFGLVMAMFGIFVVFDLIAEPAMLRLGVWTYAGSIRSLSLFAGTYYQFPIYQAVFFPICYTAWVALRFFTDDRGRTFAERGVDDLSIGPKRKALVRGLALVGACNVIMLVLFSIPSAIFGLYADPWPQDVLKRSYFTDGFCGPGTTYACSGPDVPVPRRDSVHLGPDGRLTGDIDHPRIGTD